MPALYIYLPVYAGYVRTVLRLYFIISSVVIAYFGDRCCHFRTKLKLLRKEDVKLASMTGWIRGFSSFRTAFHLRTLPGGWLGLLMVFSAAIAIASDLVVAYFVSSQPYAGRCSFGEGMVLDSSTMNVFPSIFSAAYRVASSAQVTSFYNGGDLGIYAKADEQNNFRADSSDIIGWWNCTAVGSAILYQNTWDNDIAQSLVSKGLLYAWPVYSNVTDVTVYSNTSSQLTILSASNYTKYATWDIKAAVAIDVVDANKNAKHMQSYSCKVNIAEIDKADLTHQIMRTISVYDLFRSWVEGFQGEIFNGQNQYSVLPHTERAIAWMLNTAFMVSGSGEDVTSTVPGGTEGCLADGSNIPSGVVALFVAVGVMASILICYAVFLWLSIFRARRKYDAARMSEEVDSAAILKDVPNGLLDWMTHAAQESRDLDIKPRTHHLHQWFLSGKHNFGRRLGIVHDNGRNFPTAASRNLIPDPKDVSTTTREM